MTMMDYDFFSLEVSWWFFENRVHSPSWNQKNWTMIMGDDYDRLWFFLKYENYGKEPLIIIIVHQEINQIIVQKISELWLQGMTMIPKGTGVDYDFFLIGVSWWYFENRVHSPS